MDTKRIIISFHEPSIPLIFLGFTEKESQVHGIRNVFYGIDFARIHMDLRDIFHGMYGNIQLLWNQNQNPVY